MSKIKKMFGMMVILGVIAFLGMTASAVAGTLTLTLATGSGPSVSITSNSGSVSYNGALGNFNLSFAAGFSTVTGGLFHMDLNTFDMSSFASDTLTITLTDAGGYAAPLVGTPFLMSYSGTTNKSIVTSLFAGKFDPPFTGTYLVSLLAGPFSGAFFNGSQSTVDPVMSSYGMVLQAAITSQAGGQTTFNFEAVDSVPEPASLLLLGAGLIGVATMVRKRK